jgi:hypothetical protein
MQDHYKFRISGYQIIDIKSLLDKTDMSSQITIGICGIGNCVLLEKNSYSYSQQDNICIIDREYLEDYVLDNAKSQAFVLFHQKPKSDFSEKSMIQKDNDYFVSNNITNKQFISCFIDLSEDLISAYMHIGNSYVEFDISTIVGHNINFNFSNHDSIIHEINLRTSQAFGKKTTNILSKLTVGIIGVSGTGSIVAEQLFRLNVGKMILVDNDIIEEKNLGRIINSKLSDATEKISKVKMFARFINNSAIGTIAIPINTAIEDTETIKVLSQCDVIFGCVDSITGRHTMNRLCTYYSIPFFDVGVGLTADGDGGIDSISGALHYVQPGGSSLLSRKVYTIESLESDNLFRSNPIEFQKRLSEKYIKNANEESPAVISVNMMLSSICINDFLARIHPYRNFDNSEIETIRVNLCELDFIKEKVTAPCSLLGKHTGKGDVKPLLDMPL